MTRERKNKIKVLKDVNLSITGLAIRATGKQTYLFVATQNCVFLYNITVKDKEFKSTLDTMGCARKCSVLAESMQDSHFMIGRNDVRCTYVALCACILYYILHPFLNEQNFCRLFIVTRQMVEARAMR